MKFVPARSLADPDMAARKIMEIANSLEPYMDGRLLVERINGPFLYEFGLAGGVRRGHQARDRACR